MQELRLETVVELRKFKRDMDRLRGARDEDLRNFCTDLHELGGAGGDLTKVARDLRKLDRDTKQIQTHKDKQKKLQNTTTSPPESTAGMDFGTRNPKYWVPGPSVNPNFYLSMCLRLPFAGAA